MNLHSHVLHSATVMFGLLGILFAPSAMNFLILVTVVSALHYAYAWFSIEERENIANAVSARDTDLHQYQLDAHADAVESVNTETQPAELASRSLRAFSDQILKGDLTARLSSQGFDKADCDTLNAALDKLNCAIDQALALADVASKGDLTTRATGKYSGHGQHLITAINGLLNGLSGVVEKLFEAVEQNESKSSNVKHVARNLTTTSERQQTVIASLEADFKRIMSGLEEISGLAENSKAAMAQTVQVTKLGRERMASAVQAMSQVEEGSKEISQFVDVITGISRQSKLLSVNAMVEAARAGEAGRSFSTVAQEIGDLAARSREAADRIAKVAETSTADVASSSKLLADAVETINQIDDNARQADKASDNILSATHEEVSCMSQSRESLSNARDCADANLSLANRAHQTADELSEVADRLRVVTQRFILNDDVMITAVKNCAAEASAALEAAVRGKEISAEDLFTRTYEPIPNTNPVQHMTPFVPITDRHISPIIESCYDLGPGVIFAAVMNIDAFLSTHSRRFSKPQGNDPVWNAANCRNRKFFKDRVGLTSAKNTSAHILQVYRRDMGGGQYRSMKDISAPIFVKGRHWGTFRIGYHTIYDEKKARAEQAQRAHA